MKKKIHLLDMRYYFHVVFQNNIIYLSLQINRYSFVKIFLIIILIIIFLIIFLIIIKKKREREKEIIVVYKYSVYFS